MFGNQPERTQATINHMTEERAFWLVAKVCIIYATINYVDLSSAMFFCCCLGFTYRTKPSHDVMWSALAWAFICSCLYILSFSAGAATANMSACKTHTAVVHLHHLNLEQQDLDTRGHSTPFEGEETFLLLLCSLCIVSFTTNETADLLSMNSHSEQQVCPLTSGDTPPLQAPGPRTC